ncbi:MAG TPA: hypothetical protein VF322_12260 [Gammaproteobacteria bacterium]
MGTDSSRLPYTLAIVCGTVLWTVTAAVGDRTEPWDTAEYWTISYPLAIVLAGVLGFCFPRRAWRWALALMLTQMLVMAVGGGDFSLLPLGLVLLGVLSLPAIGVASLASKVSPRKARQ